jgi:hypothetical protein
MIDKLMEGSAGDDIVDEAKPHLCGGFLNLLQELRHCLANTLHLWLKPSKASTKVYFCKATHLVRYLIKKNCKQGAKMPKVKAKAKPTAKKRKATEVTEATEATKASKATKAECSDGSEGNDLCL